MTQIATSRDADPALAARVRRTLGAPDAGPLAVLEGGRSGLTYVISDRGTRRVVKAVPPGSKAVGRNDVLRQSYVLSALAGRDVPVPRVIARDAEEPAWFAMEFAEGAALEPVYEPAAALPSETARRQMLTAAAVLGRLHAVPLADLAARLREAGGEPPAAADPADELARWTRTMHAVPEELRPSSEELLAALAASVPPAVAPVLVHGDFRLGNLMAGSASSPTVSCSPASAGPSPGCPPRTSWPRPTGSPADATAAPPPRRSSGSRHWAG